MWTVRLRRLKDAVKSVEQLQQSVSSLHQWLVDIDERLISPVVYQLADTHEIQKHLAEQEASADARVSTTARNLLEFKLLY